MNTVTDNTVELIKSEGFTGAHSFILLTRYASLADDKALMDLVGNTLKDLSSMPVSAALAYAYAEYYEAAEADFCRTACDYILNSCGSGDRMLPAAYAKCARVFSTRRYLDTALDMLEEPESITPSMLPFTALALLELYRATYNGNYLNKAVDIASNIQENFRSRFSADDVYDLEEPSANSAVAVLYDSLSAIVQEENWKKAREVQNRFIKMLADKYPTRVAFGQCALLADQFERKTVVCVLPGEEYPKELKALLSYYSPLTEKIVIRTETDKARYFIMENGELKNISGV